MALASEEIIRECDDEPYKAAIRMELLTLQEYENRSVIESVLDEWNNDPNTPFEELKIVLKESIDEIKKQLN